MNKKAFIFTLTTLLLMSSIFLITSAYLRRNLQAQNFITESVYSNKVKYMRENVVSDFYSIMDIELDEIIRNDTHVIVKFYNFSNITEKSPYLANLADYKDFIETNYSLMLNSRIKIEEFIPEFTLYPYNTTFTLDGEKFYMYANDVDRLREIWIDIYVNASFNYTHLQPTDDGGSNPIFWVRIFNNESNITINRSLHLDPYKENDPFVVKFNDSGQKSNITVFYGKFRKIRYYGNDVLTNGTLYIRSDDCNARVDRLQLVYNNTDKKVIMQTRAYMFLD